MLKSLSLNLISRKLVLALLVLTGLMLMLSFGLLQGAQYTLDKAEKSNDLSYFSVHDALGQPIFEQQYEKPQKTEDGTIIHETFSIPHQKMAASVQINKHEESPNSLAAQIRGLMLYAIIGGWLIALLSLVGMASSMRKQTQILLKGVWRLSAGDFGGNIPANQLNGDLKQLADLLNDMSYRLRTYEDQNIETLTFERNKMEGILLSIAEGVLVGDNDGTLIIVNDAGCEMLGLTHSDVILGKQIGQFVADDGSKPFEPVIREYHKNVAHYLSSANPNHLRNHPYINTVEVSGRTFRVILSSIRDKDDQSLGFVMIMRDITRETEIDRLKTQFISNVSHELRTPVTTIKSYVDTLFHHGDELDKETYHEFMATINQETDRLKKMVNDILDFSRLESPEIRLEMDYQDVTPIINLTVQSVKVLASQKNLTVTTAIESNLPKVYMNGDSIERALRNLLSNAIKYTNDGGRIKVKTELSNDTDEIIVQVEDTGVGIPDEHIGRIWDRFYRVENDVHTIKGTGLGLHLVKLAIEEHHNGKVFAYSQVDKGTTIGFSIPIHPPKEPSESQGKNLKSFQALH